MVSLAAVTGPIWAGFVYGDLGQAAPYWTGAAITAAAIALLALSVPRSAWR